MKCLAFRQKFIWNICYFLCCLAFGFWLMDAVNNYAKMWASSTVSLKNGDDGDRLVKFPVISLCKIVERRMKDGLWKNAKMCKGLYNFTGKLLYDRHIHR